MCWADAAEKFTNALASTQAVPGGGAAAATAGAMGCALVLMSVGTTLKRKGTPAEFVQPLQESNARLTGWLDMLQNLARQDANAYENYLKAYRLPKTDFARETLVQEALWAAACVPADTADVCRQIFCETGIIREKISPIIISDVLCAQHLLRGAMACCVENIRTNLQYITVPERAEKLKKLLETYESNGK